MLPITERQKEILAHIADGETAKEVGRALGITPPSGILA
jgi:DNA-binding CsgD family transcriptional regulator